MESYRTSEVVGNPGHPNSITGAILAFLYDMARPCSSSKMLDSDLAKEIF